MPYAGLAGLTRSPGSHRPKPQMSEALDDGDGLHWRTRMRYAIDEQGTVGLRAARSHQIIPAADCPLAVTEIQCCCSGNC